MITKQALSLKLCKQVWRVVAQRKSDRAMLLYVLHFFAAKLCLLRLDLIFENHQNSFRDQLTNKVDDQIL